MNSFKYFLPSLSLDVPLVRRLFEVTLFFSILFLGFWVGYGITATYDWQMMAIYSTGFVGFIAVYIYTKRGGSIRISSLIYYYLATLLLALGWIPSGGSIGVVIRVFVLLFISGLMVLNIRDYLLYIIALTAMAGLYSILEYQGIIEVTPPEDPRQFLLEISWSNFVMLCLIGIGLFHFKRIFLHDRQGLKKAYRQLEIEMLRAEAADHAKSQFLATISHEMRTPLNGIVGLSNLLKESNPSPEQQEMIRKLIYSSNLLHSLISDVLDISLIENNKLVLQENTFDLKKELEDIIGLMTLRLGEKRERIALSLEMDQALNPELTGDINRVRQVLINLLNNSIKYTETGSIHLAVNLLEETKDLLKVEFRVIDTGIGIAESKKKDLFTNFYKASENQQIEGTGLGLSISKNLVELMGGAIDFNTEYKKGSEFYFHIPFRKVRPPKHMKAIESLAANEQFASVRTLLAEDQEVNRFVAERVLSKVGVTQIDVAVNGQEAVEMATKGKYDLILMDIQMPLMDGIEATRKIMSALSQPPVIIAITANAMKEDMDACLNAGMSDFISKPFTSDQLAQAIDQHVLRKPPADME